MDMDRLLENLFAAELGRDWDTVQSISKEILSVAPLKPWIEGSARRCLAIAHVALSRDKDAATKLSLRQAAVEEARRSIQAYERDGSPDARGLSQCYGALGFTLDMLSTVVDENQLAAKQKLCREAASAAERAVQLDPSNTEAQETLQKARKWEGRYSQAIKESSKGGCFGVIIVIAALMSAMIPLAKALIR